MEVPRRTGERSDKEDKLDKGSVRRCMQLFFLFITIVVVKGLLITTAHFLLMVIAGESLDLKVESVSVTDSSTDGEKLQLHAEIQRLTALLHEITMDSRCQFCPNKWHRFRGHCYFISAGLEDDRLWAESVKYCAENNASLGIIQHEAEMFSIKVQWDSEHRDCADLRGDRSVFASDCESYGPWLCEKPIELPEI